jgi:hypothetical protein
MYIRLGGFILGRVSEPVSLLLFKFTHTLKYKLSQLMILIPLFFALFSNLINKLVIIYRGFDTLDLLIFRHNIRLAVLFHNTTELFIRFELYLFRQCWVSPLDLSRRLLCFYWFDHMCFMLRLELILQLWIILSNVKCKTLL